MKLSSLFESRLYQAIVFPQNFCLSITERISSDQLILNENINDFLIIAFVLQKLNFNNSTLLLDFEDCYLLTQ